MEEEKQRRASRGSEAQAILLRFSGSAILAETIPRPLLLHSYCDEDTKRTKPNWIKKKKISTDLLLLPRKSLSRIKYQSKELLTGEVHSTVEESKTRVRGER